MEKQKFIGLDIFASDGYTIDIYKSKYEDIILKVYKVDSQNRIDTPCYRVGKKTMQVIKEASEFLMRCRIENEEYQSCELDTWLNDCRSFIRISPICEDLLGTYLCMGSWYNPTIMYEENVETATDAIYALINYIKSMYETEEEKTRKRCE